MATIAVGDIHGNLAALTDILDQIRPAAGSGDTVVFLGDYIDRGPDSKACIEAILRLKRESQAEVVCLMGNHEDWLLETMRDHRRHSWLLGMEGLDTVESYSVAAARTLREAATKAGPELLNHCALPYEDFFASVPPEHVEFFKTLRLFHRNADCLCSHGGLDPRVVEVEKQSRHGWLWGVDEFPDQYRGAETVVYGHWNNALETDDGWPAPIVVGRTIGIDTIAHGVLTAIRLPDRTVFQSARFPIASSNS
jgi:serine/threonine protein phosphatase 1